MLADTDAGSVITAAQSGAQWGYRLLLLQLLLMPILYIVQELTVRLGIVTASPRCPDPTAFRPVLGLDLGGHPGGRVSWSPADGTRRARRHRHHVRRRAAQDNVYI